MKKAQFTPPLGPSILTTAHRSGLTGKRKQAWGKIFGGPGGSGTSGPSSNIPIAGTCELTVYLDSDNVVAYDDSFVCM